MLSWFYYNEKEEQILCVVMKLIFLPKSKNMMSAEDRPGCLGRGMVLRSGAATCLIVRGLVRVFSYVLCSTSVIRLLSRTVRILYLKNVAKTEERDVHLILLSSFGQL